MAAILEEQNNKSFLHKNKTFFPKERIYTVFLLQHGRCEHPLMFEYRYVSHKGYGFAAGVVCLVCRCFVFCIFFLCGSFSDAQADYGKAKPFVGPPGRSHAGNSPKYWSLYFCGFPRQASLHHSLSLPRCLDGYRPKNAGR